MGEMLINGRPIGPTQPAFIVAEVGINHNGELDRAIEMIHVARACGCDAVKFQTFHAAEFVNDTSQLFTYLSQGHEVTESMLEMFQRYEFPERAWATLKAECEKAQILFFSTPQNLSDLSILLRVGVGVIKVGSDDFTNLPLLKSYAGTGLPLILSTGMSDLGEVYQALETVGGLDGYPTAVLVCTSEYPTAPSAANLARIRSLIAAFPMIPIGFSDHTQGPVAAAVAAALGACIFEKHFTLDQNLPGPDHWFSEDPNGLATWVSSIRTAQLLIGSPLVRPTVTERRNKVEYQRRLVAARDIAAHEVIDESCITARRVAGGRGLPPALLNHLLGHAAPRSYRRGEPIEL